MPDDIPNTALTRRRTISWANPEDLARARRATTGRNFFEQVAAGAIPPPPLYDAVSIAIAAERKLKDPDYAYDSFNRASSKRTLSLLADLSPSAAEISFRQACNVEN